MITVRRRPTIVAAVVLFTALALPAFGASDLDKITQLQRLSVMSKAPLVAVQVPGTSSAKAIPFWRAVEDVIQAANGTVSTFQPACDDLTEICALDTEPFGRGLLECTSNVDCLAYLGAGTGAGDVVGPASSTNSDIACFDGATGKLLKDCGTNVPTASALLANGANCSAGNYPLGVDASGAVEGCTAAGGTDTTCLDAGVVCAFAGSATEGGAATNVSVTANSTDSTSWIPLVGGSSGSQAVWTDPHLIYDASANLLNVLPSSSAADTELHLGYGNSAVNTGLFTIGVDESGVSGGMGYRANLALPIDDYAFFGIFDSTDRADPDSDATGRIVTFNVVDTVPVVSFNANPGALVVSLAGNATETGNSAATETDCLSYTIDALTLARNGYALTFDAFFRTASNGTAGKRFRAYFAGTAFWDSGSIGTNAGTISLRGKITRVSGTSARYTATADSNTTGLRSVTHGTFGAINLDTTDYTIKFTTYGTNANDAYCMQGDVWLSKH